MTCAGVGWAVSSQFLQPLLCHICAAHLASSNQNTSQHAWEQPLADRGRLTGPAGAAARGFPCAAPSFCSSPSAAARRRIVACPEPSQRARLGSTHNSAHSQRCFTLPCCRRTCAARASNQRSSDSTTGHCGEWTQPCSRSRCHYRASQPAGCCTSVASGGAWVCPGRWAEHGAGAGQLPTCWTQRACHCCSGGRAGQATGE